jgi:hypothetical protein
MTPRQTVFAIATTVTVFVLILELVRRRRLREEYAWLWLLTGALMFVLVVWYRLLVFVTWAIGAVLPVTTLLLCSVLFLLTLAIHYSVIVSRLTTQVTHLAQELAILSAEHAAGPER